MTSFFTEAVQRAGGEDRLCDECRPVVASYDTALGVGKYARGAKPSISTLLVDAIAESDACWHCGWLASVVVEAWCSEPVAFAMPPDSSIKAYVNWHTIAQREMGTQSVPEGSSQITRMAVYYGLDTPDFTKRQILFSKTREEPKHVSSLMGQHQALNWPVSEPYAGRIRPRDVDYRLLRRWKECCIRDHGGTCDQTFMTSRVQSLRFVDVVDRCIVQHSPDTVKWAALSYCWGGPQVHALQTGNIHAYQQPGALIDDLLPKGIADALSVTRALGERYLWIDSLCIIQDDEKDKLELIAAMGTIYAQAVVTIVNAANSQVAHGMPGISQPRRRQQVHRMKDFWLVESMDLPHQNWEGYLENATWNTRGWTFQEGLLSPRCLVIGKDQVYWQCKTSSWCEDSCWENVPGNSVYRHYSGSRILGRLTDSREEDWIQLYSDVLGAYLKRELTSESDRLGAVQAILEVLRRGDEEGYFWGMPKGHMEMTLSWASSSHNIRRDCDSKYMGPNNEVLSSPFPTWSWLGWHGHASMLTMGRALMGGRLGLKFYCIKRDSTLEALNETPFCGPERDFSNKDYMKTEDLHEQIGYPRGLAHSSIKYDEREVTEADIPQSILASKQLPAILCFWTSTAILEMKYEGWNHYHQCPAISLGHGDVRFYGAWEKHGDFKLNGKGKFIVVGTQRTRMSHGGDVTADLLLVDEDEDGILYRRKLVTYVPESVWDKLTNRRWELVFLA
ncbi:uncharacterized protein JN550_005805 [Neoarthrinium moseri]|uniref:uncharacterized protein n=1 Tax=Neoarthrinium moseri TaxID=1658444 RepID=UPI001FDD178A|nr:uncharacterized protein JN550_005805 [Neoarthrinium moseri]KAI1869175.1 hypothetical protein JN550_005805 [Neoarthrinium moseri]